MRAIRFLSDVRGAAAIEFAFTAPAFLVIAFGMIEACFLLWTQFSLQQGVDMGARCGSVNTTMCGTNQAIQGFAAKHAYGLNPPLSTFSVSTPSCGTQVTATYPYPIITAYFGSVTLTAQSCFPK